MNKVITIALLAGMTATVSLPLAADIDLGSGPDEKLISFTKCSDIALTNVMTGYLDSYTFQQGFSQEKRSGLIKREKGEVKSTCILPSLQPQQMVYMEVDTEQLEAAGDSNNWSMQCIRSDKPSEGALENETEVPYKVNYLSGKDMMLHCGHSEKNAGDCGEGSNSSRSGQWKKKLEESGKTMLSVLAQKSSLAPEGGEKLYCQYYNKASGKSLFAFEYIRTK